MVDSRITEDDSKAVEYLDQNRLETYGEEDPKGKLSKTNLERTTKDDRGSDKDNDVSRNARSFDNKKRNSYHPFSSNKQFSQVYGNNH